MFSLSRVLTLKDARAVAWHVQQVRDKPTRVPNGNASLITQPCPENDEVEKKYGRAAARADVGAQACAKATALTTATARFRARLGRFHITPFA